MCKLKMLNLGCGNNNIPGFINVDLDNLSHVNYQLDIRNLYIFENESIDLIYSSHSLEYFDRFEVIPVLLEWRRVLKKGGLLRIAVPDFEAIVKVYLKYKDLDNQGIIGPLYGRWPYTKDTGETEKQYHKTTYDFNSLVKVLEKAGFANIRKYDWRETIHRDYDDFSQAYIPHMDKENGILISLNVEAEK